ncbi:hypothetical protein ACFQH2_03400 [Natronoarchaeum sp. GCM10025703]|uniref:hypothetical protein n=1 Tax=unclassified Natronoarchaeum TaxID=2620183 RepID=UPI00360EF70A
MIVGLGALTVGGGAVFGSGAFSQTQAQRSLEVNVVTGSDLAEEFVDIVIDSNSYDSIALLDEGGSEITTPGNEFPTAPDTDYNQDPATNNDFDGNAVSVMDQDVTVVFGTGALSGGQDLPANSTVTYNDLFHIVNDSATTTDDFDVTFGLDGGNYNLSFNSPSMNPTNVGSGSTTTVGETVLETGGSSDSTGTLTITITKNNP